jgi:hypothetical protein
LATGDRASKSKLTAALYPSKRVTKKSGKWIFYGIRSGITRGSAWLFVFRRDASSDASASEDLTDSRYDKNRMIRLNVSARNNSEKIIFLTSQTPAKLNLNVFLYFGKFD